jgi:hypothetical protein
MLKHTERINKGENTLAEWESVNVALHDVKVVMMFQVGVACVDGTGDVYGHDPCTGP